MTIYLGRKLKTWQDKLLKQLMSLSDNDLNYLFKKRLTPFLKPDLDPPFTEEEKFFICGGILIKYTKSKILQELKKLKK